MYFVLFHLVSQCLVQGSIHNGCSDNLSNKLSVLNYLNLKSNTNKNVCVCVCVGEGVYINIKTPRICFLDFSPYDLHTASSTTTFFKFYDAYFFSHFNISEMGMSLTIIISSILFLSQ